MRGYAISTESVTKEGDTRQVECILLEVNSEAKLMKACQDLLEGFIMSRLGIAKHYNVITDIPCPWDVS